jgi:sugar/nucleoside kinase (ribokinase family)
MMKSVLFVGDINVDLMMGGLETPPVVDREVTSTSFALTMGSSVVITAANYSGLGGVAEVAGLVGNDEYGRYMIAGMKEHRIGTELVQHTDEVGTGVTVNLIYRDTRTQITYPGTIAAFEDTAAVEASLKAFSHIHFSGVYQQHRLRPKLRRLLELVHEAGATTSLDPQWDPRERWESLEDWLPLLDYFFVNEDEAISITHERKIEKALQKLRDRTPCPIGKIGRKGAIVLEGNAPLTIPSYSVQVRDTTGAGDAFSAGLLFARLEREMGLIESTQFANAVAARNCTEQGGINLCPSYDEINDFMESHSERT